jgi:hypothetical protein
MKELEEHLRAITEQVKIRRKLLKDFTETKKSVKKTISYTRAFLTIYLLGIGDGSDEV